MSMFPGLPPCDLLRVRITSVGDSEVGKSCFIKRYCEGKFVSRYIPTIGVDYGVRELQMKTSVNAPVKVAVNFWDCTGNEQLKPIAMDIMDSVQCVLGVYDIGNTMSFVNLKQWIEEIEAKTSPTVVCIVGNKLDEIQPHGSRPRQVQKSEAEKYAQSKGYMFYETSCSTGENVNEVITSLVQYAIDTMT